MFKKEIKNVKDFQGTSVINYPELKTNLLELVVSTLTPERKPFESKQTLIIKEYSIKNDNEPIT